MNDIIEFKFKEKGQRVNWEDLPIIKKISLNYRKCYSLQIAKTVNELKILYRMVEIRWNYYGSSGGHYVDGNVSRYS